MTLYHFTCDHGAAVIPLDGITLGAITYPVRRGRVRIERGWQWLTTNPDPLAQAWATRNSLPCDRRSYRFAVEIPRDSEHLLYTWLRLKLAMAWPAGWIAALEAVGGFDAWRIYHGRIPASWCKGPEKTAAGAA